MASLAACGGSSSGSDEPEGKYEMKVVKATFPTKQDLGQTSLMRIAVRNTGRKTVPAAGMTVSIAGEEGQTSSLPFGIHDPQPGLAQPDRPVWVVGALKPGKTVEGIWKLSAVKAGRFTVLYTVDAGLGGKAKAETDTEVTPGGTFKVQISPATPNVEVTDSGEVVEIGKGAGQGKKSSGG
jgi:hypothetical protein